MPDLNENIISAFRAICHEHGWKCTQQRLYVYAFVHANCNHPGIDDVWRHVRKILPSVTRESIYRILEELSEARIISRLDSLTSARYDSETGFHCHLLCRRCGKILDYTLSQEPQLPPELSKATIIHRELRLTGICPACSHKTAKT